MAESDDFLTMCVPMIYTAPSYLGWRRAHPNAWLELAFSDRSHRDAVVGVASMMELYGGTSEMSSPAPSHYRMLVRVPFHRHDELFRVAERMSSEEQRSVFFMETGTEVLVVVDRRFPTRFYWIERQVRDFFEGRTLRTEGGQSYVEPIMTTPIGTR
jgi:hypothetical protein